MASTGVNFIQVNSPSNNPVLFGSAVVATPFIAAVDPVSAQNLVNVAASAGVPLDRFILDLAMRTIPPPNGATILPFGKFAGGFAKNGCILQTLLTTTTQDVDLTNTATNTPAGNAGDTVFATVYALLFNNLGATDLTVKPGGSNPSNIPKFAGTTPTLLIPAGGVVCVYHPAGVTIDSTHKVFTITPTSGGSLAIAIGGA